MSDDLDLDMEVVEDDELDDLGTDGASSSGSNVSEGKISKGTEDGQRDDKEYSNHESGSKESGSSSEGWSALGTPPEDWETRKVGELTEMRNGEATDHIEEEKAEYTVYGSNGSIGSYHEPNFDGGLVVGRVGAVGEVEWVPEAAWVSDNAIQLSVEDAVNDLYLYYALDGYEMAALATTTAQPLLNQSTVSRVNIPTPPLPEQRKIASVLYTVDQAIQKTEAIIDQAKRVKRGLMQDLLQRSRNSSAEGEGSWQQLGEVTEWRSGSTPSKGSDAYWGGTTPWVSAKDMKEVKLDGAEDHLTLEGVDEFGRLAPRGSLLVLVRGMRLKDSFPVCLVEEEVAFNQDVKALTPMEGVDGEFLAYWLKANESRILGLVTSASHGTKRLGTESLKNFRVWIPPKEYQRKTVRIFRAIDQKIREDRVYRSRLEHLKKGLMQDLLTGEVRTMGKAIEVLDEVKAHG